MAKFSDSPKTSAWWKYCLAGSGVPCAVLILALRSPASHDEVLQQQVEHAFGLSKSLMSDEMRICELAEKRHSISETDWKKNLDAYHSGNKNAKVMSMQTLAFLRQNNPHPNESIALAKEFIATNPIGDWHAAIRVLQWLGDPSWKTYNDQGLQSNDPVTRQGYLAFDEQVLKLPLDAYAGTGVGR